MKLNEIDRNLQTIRDFFIAHSMTIKVPDSRETEHQLKQSWCHLHHKSYELFEISDDESQKEQWIKHFCGKTIKQLIHVDRVPSCPLYIMSGHPRYYYQLFYACVVVERLRASIGIYRQGAGRLSMEDLDLAVKYFKNGHYAHSKECQKLNKFLAAIQSLCGFVDSFRVLRSPQNDHRMREEISQIHNIAMQHR